MWIQPLDQEDPLEEEMATHSSILAWKIPWTGEPGGQQSTESQESDTTERIKCAQALRSQKSTFKCISAVALVCGFFHYGSHGNQLPLLLLEIVTGLGPLWETSLLTCRAGLLRRFLLRGGLGISRVSPNLKQMPAARNHKLMGMIRTSKQRLRAAWRTNCALITYTQAVTIPILWKET